MVRQIIYAAYGETAIPWSRLNFTHAIKHAMLIICIT